MIIFRVAQTKHDHGWCVAVRTLVFEVEQHVDIGLEVDQHEDACRHILGIDDRIPFAAARWRIYKPGVAKIERVAVLKAWRGRNLGTALMDIRYQKRRPPLQNIADRGAGLHNRSTRKWDSLLSETVF